MLKLLKSKAITCLVAISFSWVIFAQGDLKFDSSKTLSSKSLDSLKNVIEEAKLLPEPTGMGGESDQLGWSIAVDGNTAVVGAPKMSSYGIVTVYIFNGSAWIKQADLLPSIGEFDDKFGISVSIDGNRILVGAYQKDDDKGAAFIYDYNGTDWLMTSKLVADDAAFNDHFGISVSLHGDKALIGAYEDHDNGAKSGSAYVFSYDGSQWTQEVKFTDSSGTTNEYFGYSVSLSANRALVGAYWDDDNGNNSGSAFVYDFNGTSWGFTQKITASDGFPIQQFGYSVSLDGDNLLIGANQDNEFQTNNGAVYYFTFDGTTWTQTQKITRIAPAISDQFGFALSLDGARSIIGSKGINEETFVFELEVGQWVQKDIITVATTSPSSKFGTAVALSNDTVLVGAYGDNIYGFSSGSAYGFNFNGTGWVENSKIIAEEGANGDAFGWYVSIDGTRALVGSPLYDENSTFSGTNVGAVYVYDFDGSVWNLTQKVQPTITNGNANFGSAVELQGNRMIVGAIGDDGIVNNSGTAYIFDFDGSQWVQAAKLSASDGNSFGGFGFSVSLSGDRALVGGHGDNEFGNNSGAVYFYELIASNWQEAQIIKANDAGANHNFGYSVSIDQDIFLVGAIRANGINPSTGTVYVYEYSGVTWQFTSKLSPDVNNIVLFGNSVSLSDHRALVGSPNEGFGYAYVFDLFAGTWDLTTKIQPDLPTSGDKFGYSVSLDGDRALIGSEGHTENGINSGSAFVFDYNGSDWLQSDIVTPANPSPNDLIGRAVSLSGDLVLMGSHVDNDRGTISGSAYIFAIASKYSVGGNVSGLIQGNELVIQNNTGDDLSIFADGPFTFLTKLNNGIDYNVTVLNQPDSPMQNCTVTNEEGTINNSDVIDVTILCETSVELIFRDGFDS